ncbi:unnamed protein product, partial [Ixodes pacificus]
QETKCAYAILLMAVYWMFELVHLSVTSLLPVFLFPILGILDTASTTAPYMKLNRPLKLTPPLLSGHRDRCGHHHNTCMTLSEKKIGLCVCLYSLELDLHQRATSLPAVDVVSTTVAASAFGEDSNSITRLCPRNGNFQCCLMRFHKGSPRFVFLTQHLLSLRWEASTSRFRHAMLLGIAYAANIGGTGSVIGTAPNLIIMGLVEELYPSSATLSFATWMIYNVPPMILCVICAWLYLYFHFIPKRFRSGQLNHEAVGQAIRKRYDDLGPISFHEVAVLAIFIVTVLLWFFRDPYVVIGWASFFPLGKNIKDATPAMLMVLLLFLIPAKPVADPGGSSLLGWHVVQKKIPWGVLLLMGGSFSMAEASK